MKTDTFELLKALAALPVEGEFLKDGMPADEYTPGAEEYAPSGTDAEIDLLYRFIREAREILDTPAKVLRVKTRFLDLRLELFNGPDGVSGQAVNMETGAPELPRSGQEVIESLVLAHACSGVDVMAPSYVEGLDGMLEALAGNDHPLVMEELYDLVLEPHDPARWETVDGYADEALTNGKRAELARLKVRAHYLAEMTQESSFSDFIADLCHLAHLRRMNPLKILRVARRDFLQEAGPL